MDLTTISLEEKRPRHSEVNEKIIETQVRTLLQTSCVHIVLTVRPYNTDLIFMSKPMHNNNNYY